jgi:protein-L-isoaspartate(D-aspartate) O-methyltransferase
VTAVTPAEPAAVSGLAARMVECQLAARGVCDERVLAAMRTVPRHRFAPGRDPAACYHDAPIPIGYGQTMSQPYMVALMTELLELHGHERVLEVGSGSGYQSAVLARLVAELYTIERIAPLSVQAVAALRELGFFNVHARVGDGVSDWRDAGPFDRILVTAGAPAVPAPLREQLADDGILVMPVGVEAGQRLQIVRRRGARFEVSAGVACRFVPLVSSRGSAAAGGTA